MSMNHIKNAELNRALCNVMAAVHHLDAHGCEVAAIEIGPRNPVLAISEPTSLFMQGAVIGRKTVGDMVRVVMSARVHDVQVIWQETYHRPSEMAANG